MDDRAVTELAEAVIAGCRAAGRKIATVESCTGGLIAGALTAIAGSSEVFERGFVTYSNEAKSELVGVPAGLIEAHGAVSAEVARAMAEGGLARSRADIAVSVTGIAGPGGGTDAKPVGLVHFACAARGEEVALHHQQFAGDRRAVREASVCQALSMIIAAVA